jgi:hypothetical protein
MHSSIFDHHLHVLLVIFVVISDIFGVRVLQLFNKVFITILLTNLFLIFSLCLLKSPQLSVL